MGAGTVSTGAPTPPIRAASHRQRARAIIAASRAGGADTVRAASRSGAAGKRRRSRLDLRGR